MTERTKIGLIGLGCLAVEIAAAGVVIARFADTLAFLKWSRAARMDGPEANVLCEASGWPRCEDGKRTWATPPSATAP